MSYAVTVKSHNPGGAMNTLKKNAAWFITAAVVLTVSVIAFNKHFGMSKEEREIECNYLYSQALKEKHDTIYWADSGLKSLSERSAKLARMHEDNYNKNCNK